MEIKKFLPLLYIFAGLFLGWLIFGGQSHDHDEKPAEQEDVIWTCSMHPEIRLPEPVPCPLCGMDLVPMNGNETTDSLSLSLSESAARMAMIRSTPVVKGKVEKEILLQGRLVPDERQTFQVSARYSGRIDRLRVSYTGAFVNKGDTLADLYSPELIAAQTEFFDATSLRKMNPAVYITARNKLRRWNISEETIDGIEEGKPIIRNLQVISPVSGTIIRRNATEGQYVGESTSLYEIADLSRIWVLFDAYEEDVPWLRLGNAVSFTIPSVPGKTFTGKISFIDPIVNPASRTLSVRVEVANPGHVLKPEMYAYGKIQASGKGDATQLVVPKTAVLWTGKRSLVYVQVPEVSPPLFQIREIILGPDLGEEYVILQGLKEGEQVVVNGAFKIDAAAQLAGKYSMMHPPAKVMDMHGEEKKGESVPHDFSKQLIPLFQAYFELKNALVATDPEKASEAAMPLKQAVTAVASNGLSGEDKQKWQNLSHKITMGSEKIMAEKKEVSVQREAFFEISNAFIQLIRNFPVAEITVYQDYCPMAFNNTGAGWLSESEPILNPYFGDKMLRCGVVKHTFIPSKP
ncbi:MAG: efflux RND transporter periplasmic adaptor subunit [Bacteroidia bacterium]